MTATDSSHLEPDIHDSETGPTQQTDTSGDASELPIGNAESAHPAALPVGGSRPASPSLARRPRRSGRERLG